MPLPEWPCGSALAHLLFYLYLSFVITVVVFFSFFYCFIVEGIDAL